MRKCQTTLVITAGDKAGDSMFLLLVDKLGFFTSSSHFTTSYTVLVLRWSTWIIGGCRFCEFDPVNLNYQCGMVRCDDMNGFPTSIAW